MNQAEAIAAAQKLGPEWKWVAMDEDSVWYAYKERPLLSRGKWQCVTGADGLALLDEPCWDESIAEIPQ